MKFHVLTLFPEMIESAAGTSILGRAIRQKLIELNTVYIRDFAGNKHGKVDDSTYGGGAGLLMQPQPVYDAYRSVSGERKLRTVYLTPQGKPFTQVMAGELAREEELVLLCGHYEGIDERVLEEIVTDRISIGDYVLTGGELPALILMDAISRLIPGVLGNESSAEIESFHADLLEYPQYTKPPVWQGRSVPEVLFTGDHKAISAFRLEQQIRVTKEQRPDLYMRYEHTQQILRLLQKRKKTHTPGMDLLRTGTGEVLLEEGGYVLIGSFDRKELYFYRCEGGAGQKMTDPEGAQKALDAKLKSLLPRYPGAALRCEEDSLCALSSVMGEEGSFVPEQLFVYTERSPLPMPRHATPEEEKEIALRSNRAFHAGHTPYVFLSDSESAERYERYRFYPSEGAVYRFRAPEE
ncbi:MAG: tRNA (guanosine(37)-N1)-methyltransferase TrmD [Lachnospiraceae bacterium]|nr:tRNA (guanosine(37)-N1)-methyltransferase TrmD [Lachnospiraceae bacterium]